MVARTSLLSFLSDDAASIDSINCAVIEARYVIICNLPTDFLLFNNSDSEV
jgi:hypothetical protein